MLGMYFYLLRYTDESTNPTKRTALIGGFAGMAGMTLAPAILVYSSLDPIIVPTAFALSCLTFAGATGGALMAPRGSMMKYGPVLGGSIFMLLGVQVVGMFWPNPILHSISLYGGLLLFTAYIAYDTQVAISSYEEGERDHVTHSLNFFVNFLAIFRRMLELVGIGYRD